MPYSRSDILNQNTQDFPNNSSGQITPAILRDFNANYVNSVQFIGDPTDSASYAASASFANSSSYAVNASAALTATTASYSNTSTSASYAVNSTSASYAIDATSASYSNNSTSASYANTATLAATASFFSGTVISASYAASASNAISASQAVSSSYTNNATTASYAVNATSASYATSASNSLFAQTASYSNTSTSASYAANATSASFASTIASGLNITASNILVTNNLNVNGTASFSYVKTVTGSAVIIGDAFIILNADTPTAPFAGIQVYDTGSASTASLEWNGLGDYWIQVDEAGNSGAMLTGPTGSKGSEVFPSLYRLTKGTGNNTIIDSNISDDGTTVQINSETDISGSLNLLNGATGSLQGTASFANNSTSASYALSASFAPSVAINTGSFATTGSNTFIGNQIITGSVNISGSLVMNGLSPIQVSHVKANDVQGVEILTNTNTTIATFGAGGGTGVTVVGQINASAFSGSGALVTGVISSSYAANSTSASFADNATSASYAASASNALNAQTASFYNGSVISASYAASASNAFKCADC